MTDIHAMLASFQSQVADSGGSSGRASTLVQLCRSLASAHGLTLTSVGQVASSAARPAKSQPQAKVPPTQTSVRSATSKSQSQPKTETSVQSVATPPAKHKVQEKVEGEVQVQLEGPQVSQEGGQIFVPYQEQWVVNFVVGEQLESSYQQTLTFQAAYNPATGSIDSDSLPAWNKRAIGAAGTLRAEIEGMGMDWKLTATPGSSEVTVRFTPGTGSEEPEDSSADSTQGLPQSSEILAALAGHINALRSQWQLQPLALADAKVSEGLSSFELRVADVSAQSLASALFEQLTSSDYHLTWFKSESSLVRAGLEVSILHEDSGQYVCRALLGVLTS